MTSDGTMKSDRIHSVECPGADLTPFMTHGFETTPRGSRGQWTLWLQRFPVSEAVIKTLEGVLAQFDDKPFPVKIDGQDKLVSVHIRSEKPDEFLVQLELC